MDTVHHEEVSNAKNSSQVAAERSRREESLSFTAVYRHSKYLPLCLSVFWILIGTVFYAVHDDLGWARALFMSVNVGWSIGWPMDGLSEFDTPMSKLFTIYHTSIGVLFAGVTVLFIAQEVGRNKDNWILRIIKMKELDSAAEKANVWKSMKSLVKEHFPSLRIIVVFLVWFSFGLLWCPFTNTEYTVAKNVDFMLSTLTAGGYMSLPSTVRAYQLVVTALYSNIGVPLLSIALGLLMSLVLESPEDNLIYHQIIDPVTPEEISFMQDFNIEDGDGIVDYKEFMILAVARIGSVSPDFIRRISDHLKLLNKDGSGKIAVHDIILSRESLPDGKYDEENTIESSSPVRRKSSLTRVRNNLLFLSRAKKIFDDNKTPSAAEIAFNISKIENLTQPVVSFSEHSTRSSTSRRMSSSTVTFSIRQRDSDDNLECDMSEDENDSCCRYDKFAMFNMSEGNSSEDDDKEDSSVPNLNCVRFSPNKPLREVVDDNFSKDSNSSSRSSSISSLSSSVRVKPAKIYPSSDNDDDNSSRTSPCHLIIPSRSNSLISISEQHSVSDDDCAIDENVSQKQVHCVDSLESCVDDILSNCEKGDHSAASAVECPSSDETSNLSMGKKKHIEKYRKIKKERRRSKRISFKKRKLNSRHLRWLELKDVLKSSHAVAFYLWFIWLSCGTMFFCFEENVSFCKGLFISTSIGYGIFWYEQSSSNAYAEFYTTCHFLVGVVGVALVMAIFARHLNCVKKNWFNDAKLKMQLDQQSKFISNRSWDDFMVYFHYYWPKVYINFFFLLWVFLGIVWGGICFHWSMLDSWLFAMTAMATGGFVSLPSTGVHEWHYLFVSMYIIVGVPLMAISCGITAHNISHRGNMSIMETKINAPMTEDELVMLKHLGIHESDEFICESEFVIFMLVRIGVLTPDLMEVLYDRYADLDRNGNGCVTYDALLRGQSFLGSPMLVPCSFHRSLSNKTENSLVNKLRLDSLGT